MRRLRLALSHSAFFRIFNLKDRDAKGRAAMLTSGILVSCINYLTGGTFYTGFLIANDIDIVSLGVISFIPFAAKCFALFVPGILSRFGRRRFFLAGMRFLYYTVLILGITLLPSFVQDKSQKVLAFGVIVFVANLISCFTDTGYTSWHLNFIPSGIRTEYFSFVQITKTFLSSSVLLFSSIVADALAGTPAQVQILYTFRYIAYALALAEIAVLSLPHEYPYVETVKNSIKDVFTVPMKNRKFMLSLFVIGWWTFNSYFTSSTWYYYLLRDIGVSYSMINFIDAAYALFLIVFSPFWRKYIRARSWFGSFAACAVLYSVTTMFYSLITPSNHVWMMLVVRLTQHVIGVGLNLSYANLAYLHMPGEDRSTYLSFYYLAVNVVSFAGLAFSTAILSITQGLSLPVLGHTFTNMPLLMFAQGAGQLLIGLFILSKRRVLLSPDELAEGKQ